MKRVAYGMFSERDLLGARVSLGAEVRDALVKATKVNVYDHEQVDAALDKCNEILNGYGVESIQADGARWDGYYCDIVLLYVNVGDSYDCTVVFDVEARRFRCCSVGDWIERAERKGVTVR